MDRKKLTTDLGGKKDDHQRRGQARSCLRVVPNLSEGQIISSVADDVTVRVAENSSANANRQIRILKSVPSEQAAPVSHAKRNPLVMQLAGLADALDREVEMLLKL